MPNPGSFKGAQLAFLENERAGYETAHKEGVGAEHVADIIRRFLLRFSVTKPLDYEPCAEELAAVDDTKPYPELVEPKQTDGMSDEVYDKLLEEFQRLKDLETMRVKQIQRWFNYQYNNPKHRDDKDPDALASLFSQLTGATPGPGCRRPAWQVFARTNAKAIDEKVNDRIAELKAEAQNTGKTVDFKKGENATLRIRQGVIKAEFEKLNKADQDKYFRMAKEEHDERVRKWRETQNAPFSTDPEARQRCIERIAAFIEPILNGLMEATGWHCTLIAGGPEPADNGRLNMISCHSGETKDPKPLNFGSANRILYQKCVVPTFAAYLQRAFAPEDCLAVALKNPGPSLATLVGDDVNHDVVHGPVVLPVPLTGPLSAATAASASVNSSSNPSTSNFSTSDSSHSRTSTSTKPLKRPLPPNEPTFSVSSKSAHLPSASKPSKTNPSWATVAQAGSSVARRSLPGTSKFKPTLAVKDQRAILARSGAKGKGKQAKERSLSPVFPSPPPPPSSTFSSPPPQASSAFSSPPSSPAPSLSNVSSPPPSPLPFKRKGRTASFSSQSGRASSPIDIDLMSSPERSPVKKTYKGRKPKDKSGFLGVVLPSANWKKEECAVEEVLKMEEEEPMLLLKKEEEEEVFLSSPATTSTKRLSNSLPEPSSSSKSPRLKLGFDSHNYQVDIPRAGRQEDYILKIMELAEEVGINHKLRSILLAYLGLEKKNSFRPVRYNDRLASVDRPDEIGDWIARARRPGYRPIFFLKGGSIHLPGLEIFVREFNAWYRSLQPHWRIENETYVEGEVRLSRTPGREIISREEWPDLYKTGTNGVGSIVAAICWWKDALQRLPEGTPREQQRKVKQLRAYKAAVDDVEYTFWAMESLEL
ncbi:SERTA domain-containing protein 3 [Paramarasmius palmivorus]|uniref:SERTA domain-containing protein 3 n=1 Tax=Paramarasmius palmivorus TaxID=297713 RepID=A0AAW0B0P7_9AGAR